jgi:hypothetical protein
MDGGSFRKWWPLQKSRRATSTPATVAAIGDLPDQEDAGPLFPPATDSNNALPT